MPEENGFTIATQRCATRTRGELAEMSFRREPTGRDLWQLQWMEARCSTCTACPMVLRALRVMLPERPKPPGDNVIAFKLAS